MIFTSNALFQAWLGDLVSLGEGLLGELFIGTKYLARLESSTRSCHMFNPM